jgi:hypothetical protein
VDRSISRLFQPLLFFGESARLALADFQVRLRYEYGHGIHSLILLALLRQISFEP